MKKQILKLLPERKEDLPWTGYLISRDDQIVGQCAFKYKPIKGKVEIAYCTYEQFQGQGIATEACKQLVEIALETDPTVRITARTLREKNSSTKVLERNYFKLIGDVIDMEDGLVWEWDFEQNKT